MDGVEVTKFQLPLTAVLGERGFPSNEARIPRGDEQRTNPAFSNGWEDAGRCSPWTYPQRPVPWAKEWVVAKFYGALFSSEMGHFKVFLKLAHKMAPADEVAVRWEELRQTEAGIIAEQLRAAAFIPELAEPLPGPVVGGEPGNPRAAALCFERDRRVPEKFYFSTTRGGGTGTSGGKGFCQPRWAVTARSIAAITWVKMAGYGRRASCTG